MPPRPRYRFGPFTVSTARRQLLRQGGALPLIPRYFDLLVLLIERRHEAVHRRDIFDSVWSDVVVSDGALSQAVRTLRRALDDDPREPRFLRTVSRHGYQFVWADVAEEADEGPLPAAPGAAPGHSETAGDPFAAPLERLLAADADEDDRREAAEALHALGTGQALLRLDRRPGHERARALLRDARFDVPGAGPVPIAGQPGALRGFAHLLRIRLGRALPLLAGRASSAAAGAAAAGFLAGLLGGLVLITSPGADMPGRVPVVLALVGAIIGGVGALGVGAGLGAAEAVVRSWRALALVAFGSIGGAVVGAAASLLGGWTIEGLFGVVPQPVGGGLEGLVIGAAAGAGYAIATPRPREGGMASPHGKERARAVLSTGVLCAAAAVALNLLGGHLGTASVEALARAARGSRVSLLPLARRFGEARLGPRSVAFTGAYEGLMFGCGLALGLTRRPR